MIRRRKRRSKKAAEKIAKLAEAHPDKRVVTYFQDEARYGQKGTITRCWAKRGSKTTAVRQNQYVYGAVCPENGESRALIAFAVDTETMSTFLRLFGSSTKPAGTSARNLRCHRT
jgi:hypothetical protein